jgi:hypothetical protein
MRKRTIPPMEDAAYFLEKADQCFGLSQMAGASPDLQLALVNLAHEFMDKAVEIDTERDRAESSRQRG